MGNVIPSLDSSVLKNEKNNYLKCKTYTGIIITKQHKLYSQKKNKKILVNFKVKKYIVKSRF